MGRPRHISEQRERELRAVDAHDAPQLNGALSDRAQLVADAVAELRAIARAGGGWLTAGSAATLLGHLDASAELVATYLEWRKKNRECNASLRARRKAAGECVDCGGVPKPGGLRCELHARRNVERTQKYLPAHRLRCKAEGLCLDCGEPVEPGRARCKNHLRRSAAASSRRRTVRQRALTAADEVSR